MCSCGENRFAQRREGLGDVERQVDRGEKDLGHSKVKWLAVFPNLPTAARMWEKAVGAVRSFPLPVA